MTRGRINFLGINTYQIPGLHRTPQKRVDAYHLHGSSSNAILLVVAHGLIDHNP